MTAPPAPPAFAALFTPKLVTVWREGYDLAALRRDAVAGLTVAIIALPLSMAIAIACGLPPAHGLYAAVVGGFLISALGGSRFQIGGPAGAFIVLVGAAVARHGVGGMLLATVMAGVILLALGLLRLGTYIKFIPYPVTVGFTAGIALIIFLSQLGELLGLAMSGPVTGGLVEQLGATRAALPTANPSAMLVSALTVAIILAVQRWRPAWPAFLIAIVAASAVASVADLPVETIDTRFGGLPARLPGLAMPEFSLASLSALLPTAFSFALLGAIESLLSAVVADGMTGRRHRSNCELFAQGVANIAAGLAGGMVVTGTVARTAANIRAGAHGPVAGMLHALFVLLFLLVGAGLLARVPLAALAGILVVVAWNMAERDAFALLLRSSRGDALVLLATFLLTVLRDLALGITVGVALGGILFINRMAEAAAIEQDRSFVPRDLPDTEGEGRERYAGMPEVPVYRIRGPFFFGAASAIGQVLDQAAASHSAVIIDLAEVPFLDSTAARTLVQAAARARRADVRLYLTGAAPAVRRALLGAGIREQRPRFRASVDDARADLGKPEPAPAPGRANGHETSG